MLLLAAGFVGDRLGDGERSEARRGRERSIDARGAAAALPARSPPSSSVAIVYLGNMWWTVEATAYDRYVYKPLAATPSLVRRCDLRLELRDPGWIGSRRLDDFVADHGHLMHLFVLSPALDRSVASASERDPHRHLRAAAAGAAGGKYELFADLVHATGVSETVTGQFETAGMSGARRCRATTAPGLTVRQSVGRIVWVRDATPLVPKRLTIFTFRAEDESGPARAAISSCTWACPATRCSSGATARSLRMCIRPDPRRWRRSSSRCPATASHAQHETAPPSTVTFPYGFPEAGPVPDLRADQARRRDRDRRVRRRRQVTARICMLVVMIGWASAAHAQNERRHVVVSRDAADKVTVRAFRVPIAAPDRRPSR